MYNNMPCFIIVLATGLAAAATLGNTDGTAIAPSPKATPPQTTCPDKMLIIVSSFLD
jgi:hypothetical protein